MIDRIQQFILGWRDAKNLGRPDNYVEGMGKWYWKGWDLSVRLYHR